MFGPIWFLSIRIRAFLRRFMPTNIALAAIFNRRGLKWGMPAMLVALPYLFAAVLCTGLIQQGAPGWVNLVVLLCLWNAIKFIAAGPLSLLRLTQVRIRESQIRRRMRVPVLSDGVELERTPRPPARVFN